MLVGFSVSDDNAGPAPGVDVGIGVEVSVGRGVAPEGRIVSVAVLVTPAPIGDRNRGGCGDRLCAYQEAARERSLRYLNAGRYAGNGGVAARE